MKSGSPETDRGSRWRPSQPFEPGAPSSGPEQPARRPRSSCGRWTESSKGKRFFLSCGSCLAHVRGGKLSGCGESNSGYTHPKGAYCHYTTPRLCRNPHAFHAACARAEASLRKEIFARFLYKGGSAPHSSSLAFRDVPSRKLAEPPEVEGVLMNLLFRIFFDQEFCK